MSFGSKELLKQIVKIYAFGERDKENIFPAAIIRDGRSYNEQIFSAAADVLRRIGEDMRIIQEFIELGAKAKVAASEAMDAEAALETFLMNSFDPIQRHLSSDSTDPFNRSHLTVDLPC
ncbi:hypothetical protein HAX54_052390 [Datura stramonium]|uniref:Ubiquitin conjugation factor E4 core domain-containing protein n=1 Tax=Datura stramonium TaxID=4076 RepID=A0ABS8WQH6_DATST|nr:hypothetical protein [Datura stramonium]